MQERILIVDDDEGLAHLTRLQLEQLGYQVRTALQGTEGIRLAQEWKPHLILLDILMPDMDGWAVYQRLREFTDAAVCFTTALDQDQHVLQGLNLGADDYIIKPFSHKELSARVRAALHRSRRAAEEMPLEVGPLRVDPQRPGVWLRGREIRLTPTEFRLLLALIRQAGRVVPHDELLRQVWANRSGKKRDSLKLYIWYLRRKLEADPSRPQMILSERGVGYRLSVPDAEARP